MRASGQGLCHGASCPLANGFYDRLPQARSAALVLAGTDVLDKDALRALAHEHRVCPYYLSQDLIQWSDVIVGDYNHYFDLGAILYGLTVANQWTVWCAGGRGTQPHRARHARCIRRS